MEKIPLTYNGSSFHVEGFPDAIKLLKIPGAKSRCLADLSLHKNDLLFALECLESINRTPPEPQLLREVLWEAAIVHFIKCFGDNASRFSLKANLIYKDVNEALAPYDFFLHLRNKNIVHDENSYTQSLPAAVLNTNGSARKIAKIICLTVDAGTLDQGSYNNLHLLLNHALTWVTIKFDELCNIVTSELEAKCYDELAAMESVAYTVPSANDVHSNRGRG
jgi:hypothetical protein